MYLTIKKPLTYKSRIRQIGDNNKFILSDNEIFATNNGIIIAPRFLYTDNITFINNTFVDIRASHVHDIGCAYHKLIVSSLTEEDLRKLGLLYLNKKATEREREFLSTLAARGKYSGDTNVDVWVCENIPIEYLKIIDISFSENNRLFKEMLIKTGVSGIKANLMGEAVYLNAGWLVKKPLEFPAFDNLFKKIIVT